MSVAETALGGDYRANLVALRDVLAAAIDDASARDLGTLTRQYLAVLKELDAGSGEASAGMGDELERIRRERARRTNSEAV